MPDYGIEKGIGAIAAVLVDGNGNTVSVPASDGPRTAQHNRNIAAAATVWANATNTFTWADGLVSSVSIPIPTTAGLTGVKVIINSPNDATTSAALADAGSQSTDVLYDLAIPGTIYTKRSVNADGTPAYITRLDVLPLGAALATTVSAN